MTFYFALKSFVLFVKSHFFRRKAARVRFVRESHVDHACGCEGRTNSLCSSLSISRELDHGYHTRMEWGASKEQEREEENKQKSVHSITCFSLSINSYHSGLSLFVRICVPRSTRAQGPAADET